MDSKPLSPEALELAKQISDEIWSTYDDTHAYATEKREANATVNVNNPDNIWYFWNQFDAPNHVKFVDRLLADRDFGREDYNLARIELAIWIAETIQHIARENGFEDKLLAEGPEIIAEVKQELEDQGYYED